MRLRKLSVGRLLHRSFNFPLGRLKESFVYVQIPRIVNYLISGVLSKTTEPNCNPVFANTQISYCNFGKPFRKSWFYVQLILGSVGVNSQNCLQQAEN